MHYYLNKMSCTVIFWQCENIQGHTVCVN